MVIYNEQIPQEIPLSVLSRGRKSLILTLQILLWNSAQYVVLGPASFSLW